MRSIGTLLTFALALLAALTIKVTDNATDAVQNFSSTKGHLFQTLAETSAFNCP